MVLMILDNEKKKEKKSQILKFDILPIVTGFVKESHHIACIYSGLHHIKWLTYDLISFWVKCN